jgi:hypothetical protein
MQELQQIVGGGCEFITPGIFEYVCSALVYSSSVHISTLRVKLYLHKKMSFKAKESCAIVTKYIFLFFHDFCAVCYSGDKL